MLLNMELYESWNVDLASGMDVFFEEFELEDKLRIVTSLVFCFTLFDVRQARWSRPIFTVDTRDRIKSDTIWT